MCVPGFFCPGLGIRIQCLVGYVCPGILPFTPYCYSFFLFFIEIIFVLFYLFLIFATNRTSLGVAFSLWPQSELRYVLYTVWFGITPSFFLSSLYFTSSASRPLISFYLIRLHPLHALMVWFVFSHQRLPFLPLLAIMSLKSMSLVSTSVSSPHHLYHIASLFYSSSLILCLFFPPLFLFTSSLSSTYINIEVETFSMSA